MTGVQWHYEEVRCPSVEKGIDLNLVRMCAVIAINPISNISKEKSIAYLIIGERWLCLSGVTPSWLNGRNLQGEGMNPCVISKTDSMATLYLISPRSPSIAHCRSGSGEEVVGRLSLLVVADLRQGQLNENDVMVRFRFKKRPNRRLGVRWAITLF
jgi:hypothetical protein